MPLSAVELEKNENSMEIFNFKHIYRALVTVEPRRKSRDILQCNNCQRYGHTKNYCRLDPRCVKCGGPHKHNNCPITGRNELP